MPKFAILRLAKLRTKSAVVGAGAHNHRLRPQPNCDAERTPLNREFVRSPLTLEQRVEKRLQGLKFRKDAVLASELVLSASPEFFSTPEILSQWVCRNLDWLREQHGTNLVSAVLHLDEATPHLHAVIVPLCPDGKLAAKRYWGGPAELVALQTAYAERMKPLGLSRGVPGSSRPTSATVQRWRGAQALAEEMAPRRDMPKPKLPPPPPLPNRFSLATMTAEDWEQAFVEYGRRCLRKAAETFKPVLAELDLMVQEFSALSTLFKGPRATTPADGRAQPPKTASELDAGRAPDEDRSDVSARTANRRSYRPGSPRF